LHWIEPKLVAEITYLTWTADNLLRHTVYVGLREDKPADHQVRRESARRRRRSARNPRENERRAEAGAARRRDAQRRCPPG
jgi:bifunctional non-homologous end joining protein LigD